MQAGWRNRAPCINSARRIYQENEERELRCKVDRWNGIFQVRRAHLGLMRCSTVSLRHRPFRMSHPRGEWRTRGTLLDALSRVIVRTRRGTKGFVYRKIRPAMASDKNDVGDLSDVILQENSDAETQCKRKLSKKPKRVLQFSDGVIEEYSSEDEVDTPKNNKTFSQTDIKNMNWLPWAWYQTTWLSSKMLDGCDYVGECLANFFGITAPKYQFEINEFYRLQALEREMFRKQDLEMGGWNEQNRNNLISSDSILTNKPKE